MNAKPSWVDQFGRANQAATPKPDPTPEASPSYQPWKTIAPGKSPDFQLTPSPASDAAIHWEPYTQNLPVDLDPKNKQLCVTASGTGNLIFIEANSVDTLMELSQLIRFRRVSEITEYDANTHGILNQHARFIKSIKVEKPE
ncbi:hypothetical protein K1718_27385 (plasmid) [Roseibium porphyridii]|uniref:Uncharacterized protein n=1 Tax=Roseibium porphyridii TaxID=2866279 RepID=A0ABY8FAX4_9HYPH|nr:hypothetical protein [Roseibium sp. KMA01]WFE92652.1 hypothetical protein K1718_27385 [Roseibium sp. KMA01]